MLLGLAVVSAAVLLHALGTAWWLGRLRARQQGGQPVRVFVETAEQIGGWDNKYLRFGRFLDVVTERATADIEQRWIDRLAGVDVFAEDRIRTALVHVRWDD